VTEFERTRAPSGTRTVPGDRHQAYGERFAATLGAEFGLGTSNRGILSTIAQGEGPREGVHAPVLIEDSVFVGIVRCASPQQCSDKRALSTKGAARHDDRLPMPANDAGMDEDSVMRELGDTQVQV
jgi:hypothetical protein